MVMYLVVVGWLYVALMMSVAEATSSNGSLLGAIVTFLLYGAGPVALVVYLMLEPARRRRRKAAAQAERETAAQPSGAPDGSGKPATDAVPPVREEP
jgi:large-conductance mechanosensitive channel